MRIGVLAFSILFGFIGYDYVTDGMGYPHETGIAIGLLIAVFCIAFMAFWLMENDKTLRQADLHRRKRGGKS